MLQCKKVLVVKEFHGISSIELLPLLKNFGPDPVCFYQNWSQLGFFTLVRKDPSQFGFARWTQVVTIAITSIKIRSVADQ